ncbi:MAG: LysR substrate-binding domain-containing protein [Burkholderiales bacterium]
MELSDLVIFRAVAREGGIVRAARKLDRVPSSVTTRIKQLEASIGVPLFTRERQRLALSQGGERLLEYAERMLRLSDEARTAVADAAPSGVLRLGALESTTASRLPAVLAAYHAAHPAMSVELTTGTNDALTAALIERRVHAAFVAETPADPRIASLPLFRERLVIVSARDHPPIHRPADVAGDGVLAFPDGCHYRRVLLRWLGERRLPSLRVLNLASYHAIVTSAAAGAGIALVPESVLATMPHAEVRRHRPARLRAQVVTPLVWRRDGDTAALAALRALLASRRR